MIHRLGLTLMTGAIVVALGGSAAAQSPVFQGAYLYGGPDHQEGLDVSVMSGGGLYFAGYRWASPQMQMARLDPGDLSPDWWAAPSHVVPWSLVTGPANQAVVAGYVLPGECGAYDGYGGTEGKAVFAVYDEDGTRTACISHAYFTGYRGYEQYMGIAQTSPPGGATYYVAGAAEQWGFGGHRYVVASFHLDGSRLSYITDPSTFSAFYDVAANEDAVYAAGFRRNSSWHGDPELPFVVKLDTGLSAEIWRQTLDAAAESARARFNGVAEAAGAVYAVGDWQTASGDTQFLAARFDAVTGAVVWQRVFGGAGQERLDKVALYGGRVFAVGYTSSEGSGGWDAALLELDPDTGDVVSTDLYGGAQDDRYLGMTIHGNDLWLAGSSRSYATPEGNQIGSLDMLLVHYSLFVNSPPVASGQDQVVACTGAAGATVTLDGSASSDPDGDALTYVWTGPFPEGGGTVTGATPSVTLPLGTSAISLVVNDGSVDSPPDTVTVTVAVDVLGFQPPLGALVPEGQTPAAPDAALRKGRTIPLKLRIGCGGTALCGPGISPPRIAGIALGGGALDIDVLDLDAGAANDGGVDFRLSDDLWIYNLDTRGLAPGTYAITVRMPDQSRWVGAFALR